MIPSSGRVCAAIDLGTVTSRLLVACVDEDAITPLVRRTVITHMGEGLNTSGFICDAAIQRVLDAAEQFNEALRDLRSELAGEGEEALRIPVYAVATSAMRDARNSARVVELLATQGIDVEIIEGSREAKLSFQGTLSGFPLLLPEQNRQVMIIDVGGGSTEVIAGLQSVSSSGAQNLLLQQAISFDIGSRRVTERFLHSDPPAASELEAARTWIAEEISPFFATLEPTVNGKRRMVFAVAGVSTTTVSILRQMVQYDPKQVHATVVSSDELAGILERLSTITLAQRRSIVGLEPERASVIVGGMLTLLEMLRAAGASEFVVSETDILEGILLEYSQETPI